MMGFGTIEILALVLIVLSVIELVALYMNPRCWFGWIEKIYANPTMASVGALILAAIVLFFLLSAGVTVTQILAITLFVALLLMIGIAPIAGSLIKQFSDLKIADYWLYTAVWLILLVWGAVEIFAS